MIDNLDGLLLAAAEGDSAAVNTLAAGLDQAGSALSAPQRLQIEENLKLVLKDFDARAGEESYQRLAFALAHCAFSDTLVRNALASAMRERQSDFADPGRLIRAIGVQSELPMEIVLARWRAFLRYEHKAVVWHDEYGLGSMREIDPLADLVSVSFKNIQRLKFDQAIATLHVAETGSLASTMVLRAPPNYDPTGNKPNSRKEPAAEVLNAIGASFTPPVANTKTVTEAIFVPKIMTLKAFDDWNGDGANKPSGGGARTWDQSRSLEELKEAIKEDTPLDAGPDTAAQMRKIFKFSMAKEASAELFAADLSRLRLLATDPSWVDELVADLEPAIAWQDEELFTKVTCGIPAKQVASWLTLARLARGHEWLVKQVVNLPLRCWDAAESVFDDAGEPIQDLFELTVRKLRKGLATADATLWLWRQDTEYVQQLFANPRAIFRVLAKQRKGDYLKAYRELRKLLMNDQDFQRTVMAGGTEEGIAAFVRIAKSTPILQQGEQQSLLVKVVRLFPDAAEIVEERRKVVERRPLPKVSSARSVALKAKELEDIAQKQIPENSRAIAHARSYGDLRENFEFKAAKERQRYLMARKADLEAGLSEISPSDFSEVVVGKTATLELSPTEVEIVSAAEKS